MKLSLLCSIGLLVAAPLAAQSGDQSVATALELLQQSQTQAAAGHLDVAAELAAAAQEILSAQQGESVQTHQVLTDVAGRVIINADGLVRIDEENEHCQSLELQGIEECATEVEAECEVEVECEISEDCDDAPRVQHVWTAESPHADHHGGNPHMRRGGHPRIQDGGDVRMQLQAVQLELQALRLELQALRLQMRVMRGGMGHGMGPQKQMMMHGMMMPQMRGMMMPQMKKRMQKRMHDLMMPQGEWNSDGDNCGGADGDWDPEFDLDAELEGLFMSGTMGLEDTPQVHSEMRLIMNGEVFEGEAAQEKLEELGLDAEMDHQILMKIGSSSQSHTEQSVGSHGDHDHKHENL